jgi:hypothetical protein
MGAKVTTSFLNSFKLKAMKTKHLFLLGIIAAFSSCSSAYRIGQTPDDVYFSPAPPQNNYVTSNNQQNKDTYAYNNTYNSEDLAIRRGIGNPRYRNNISLDFGYGYNPYDYYGSSFYNPYSSYYNPYSSFYNPYTYTGVTFYPYNYNYNNSYYSPYYNNYYPPVYYIPKSGGAVSNYSGPRKYNMGVYNNNTNANPVYTHPVQPTTTNSVPVRTFQTQPTNTSGVGNFIRRVFSGDNSSNNSYNSSNNRYNSGNSNNSSSSRTFDTRSSNSNSSSNSNTNSSTSDNKSSGSAPVRTFKNN